MAERASTLRLLAALVAFLLAVIALLAGSIVLATPATAGAELPISAVQALAAAGRVQTAVLHDADHRITGTYLPAPKASRAQFWSQYPASDAEVPVLVDRLAAGGATVTADGQPTKVLLQSFSSVGAPVLILADLLAIALLLIARGLSPAEAVRSLRPRKRTTPAPPREETALTRAAGVDQAAAALRELAGRLRRAAQGGSPPRGVLIHGPPGCGKTLLARGFAAEAGARLVALEEWRSGPHDAAQPLVVLAENVDGRGEAEVGALLRDLDAIAGETPAVVVATAGRIEAVDPELLRPERLAARVLVDLPDARARRAILEVHAQAQSLDRTVTFDELAAQSIGLTGADLAAVVWEAAHRADRARRRSILAADLDAALQAVIAAPGLRGRALGPDERRRLAVHQAGHAITAAALGRGRHVQGLSVLAHSQWIELGGRDGETHSRSDLLAQLTVLCGGLAAEELYFDEPSTVSEPDLAAATTLATQMVGRYGMSSDVGRAQISEPTPEVHAEIRRLLDDATSAATDRLQRCHEPLVDLVLQLERDEVVDGVQLGDLLIRALEVEVEGMAAAGPVAGAEPSGPVPAPQAPSRSGRGTTIAG